jgi:gas vesicle protein
MEDAFMNTNDGNGGSGFALGMLAGVIVGAGVALLFAPKAGQELRQDLGESMGKLKDAAARRYRDVADKAGRATAEIRKLDGNAEKAIGAEY